MAGDRYFPASAMPDRDWWAALWPDPEAVLRTLGIQPGMTVLDLCCGDGYFTAPLAALVDGKVYALDLDPRLLKRARAEVARRGAEVAEWLCGDAREMAALVPQRVDYVWIANTFHGVPDKTGLACAVAGVLKPDGRFAVVNWHQLPREQTTVLGKPRGPRTELRMSPAQVRAAVEPAGFSLERVVELPPYHYGAVFVRAASLRLKNVWPAPSASGWSIRSSRSAPTYPASECCPRPRWSSARPGPHKGSGIGPPTWTGLGPERVGGRRLSKGLLT